MFLVCQAQYETKTAAAKVKKKHGKKSFKKTHSVYTAPLCKLEKDRYCSILAETA